jgi:hypothetical protein
MGGILHTVAYGATGLAFAFVILSLGNNNPEGSINL